MNLSKVSTADLQAELDKRKPGQVTLFWIGGYELTRDGTKKEEFFDVDSLQEHLDDCEIEFSSDITSLTKLAESVEREWEVYNDDGGGSGWIEYE